jgi:hypothetical protein
VREQLGVKYVLAAVRAVAEAVIRKAVQSKDNPADLINVALDELVRQSCELPRLHEAGRDGRLDPHRGQRVIFISVAASGRWLEVCAARALLP